ncbi:NAD(P)/FAD-dependent oxidoreductase [Actinophytocola oryzae]|uniref:NADPH-dependent 2,4-dienoyl-CoA reductase/sulfur reductase-like enzyme n=1 Tax=Actinophytocola oryzae TaxID=502181 RepID=A0A4R7VQH7_9PSEU|nr:FAD-dependent oxidoreductase [Actinophytocola oryzae]TDV52003.1 NADPH-dependent 2,4-dienoyl-CoA reductase/sulfur reductase-like enzyme [Actinophytocola oryzae]
MVEPRRIVIVGTGLAGASAAGALREQGYDGEVLLIGEQRHRPYELPALSKGILLGDTDDPDWVHDESFYGEKNIDLRLGTRVGAVNVGDRTVDVDGTAESWDRLVLATGSTPRRLRVPGNDFDNVRRLRRLDDARSLRQELTEGRNIVIIGAGWIGCEVAAAARKHGANVTVVDTLAHPLHRVLGDTVSGVFRALHESQGVTFRMDTGVVEYAGADGKATAVRLEDGTELPADLVLVAVGAEPRTDLAQEAGLALSDDGGVQVDATLRTSAPDVFAVGDIAAHAHPRLGRRIRVEHWANAKDQGAHVAQNVLGASEPFAASPYFFSDQYDLGMEFRGLADPFGDELVVRGDLTGREFIAFWLRDGAVQAAMNVNMWDDGDTLQALVDQRVRVEPAKLVDADLASLMG